MDAIRALSLEDILDEGMGVARGMLPGRVLALMTGEAGSLTVSRSFGLDGDGERRLEQWAAGMEELGARGVALEGADGVRGGDGAQLGELRAVPLSHRGASYGAIVAIAPDGGGFSDRDTAGLEILAARLTTDLVVNHVLSGAGAAFATHVETGMPGLRELHATLDRELQRRTRYGHTPTLAMLALEGWSEIAATKGEEEAAVVLRETSEQIVNFCRVSDFPFHLGADRFALVLPEAGHDGASVLCSRLHGAVDALPSRVALIWGLAVAGQHGDTRDQLINRAEQQVTRAHSSARERVTAEEHEQTRQELRVSSGLSYYQQLGLERNASQEEIKAAFRTLARRYHPDQTNLENRELAELRFQEITRAYRVLSDPERRTAYDGPTGGEAGTDEVTPGIDYYMALRVRRDAAAADIAAAYRKLAYDHRVSHRHGKSRAEERFKVVSEAYRVLASPATRQAYDRTLPPPAPPKKDSLTGLLRRDNSLEVIARDTRKARERLEASKRDADRAELERLARLADSARRLVPDEPLIGRSLARLESALASGRMEQGEAVRVARDLETGMVA